MNEAYVHATHSKAIGHTCAGTTVQRGKREGFCTKCVTDVESQGGKTVDYHSGVNFFIIAKNR